MERLTQQARLRLQLHQTLNHWLISNLYTYQKKSTMTS